MTEIKHYKSWIVLGWSITPSQWQKPIAFKKIDFLISDPIKVSLTGKGARLCSFRCGQNHPYLVDYCQLDVETMGTTVTGYQVYCVLCFVDYWKDSSQKSAFTP